MNLVSYSIDGKVCWGLDLFDRIVDGNIAAMSLGSPGYEDLRSVIEDGDSGLALLNRMENAVRQDLDFQARVTHARQRVTLRPPISNPRKLLCLAGNYRAHIQESGFQAPQTKERVTPQVFLKPSSTIVGPFSPILIQKESVAVDWEVELAAVIGRRGKYISVANAPDYVFGYSIINDVSERKMNSRMVGRKGREWDGFFDWLNGKWFDSFAPLGPAIVTSNAVGDPHDLSIRLKVNGELMQDSNTKHMISSVPDAIAYISSFMTLEPGDIIAMGTPAGVGMASNLFLKPGDTVDCELEKIGRIENTVQLENSVLPSKR
jgi:2-keto-4-pentenoate hydratase/2-oxohepta-3-ene-1,7-dioic acid hydratase in catechol pathway